MKLGEELNVDIAKPRQAGGGNQSESVSEYYGKVWRSALQNSKKRPQPKVWSKPAARHLTAAS